MEAVDLFTTPEVLPIEVQAILNKYSELDQTCKNCEDLREELNEVGYECDYDLGGTPFDLIKIPTEVYEVGEVVYFQAYKEHEPIKGIIKRMGTLAELNRMQLTPNDPRIFYELTGLNKSLFTITTQLSMFKVPK